jgi:ribosomal protein S30
LQLIKSRHDLLASDRTTSTKSGNCGDQTPPCFSETQDHNLQPQLKRRWSFKRAVRKYLHTYCMQLLRISCFVCIKGALITASLERVMKFGRSVQCAAPPRRQRGKA